MMEWVDTSLCPDCGGFLTSLTVDEPVLLRGGGYGGTRHTVTDTCEGEACGWGIVREVSEVRP